jgi:hypothetical protein
MTPQVDGPSFACHCGSTFSRIENLVRHTKTHASERPWACRVCDKAFTRPDLLKRHEKIHDRGKTATTTTYPQPESRAESSRSAAGFPPYEPTRPQTTLAGYPYNRASPPRDVQPVESYERGTTHDGPSRKRAREDSLSPRRHSPVYPPESPDSRLTGLSLPVHRGIGHGATTLPSLSEDIIMRKSPDRYPFTSGYADREGESRTPYDSRGGSPTAAGPMYDSTLPSAGLEALSAVADGSRKEPEQVDLAVRMESLAPRKPAVGASLSSLMNAYDQGVGTRERKTNAQTESECWNGRHDAWLMVCQMSTYNKT